MSKRSRANGKATFEFESGITVSSSRSRRMKLQLSGLATGRDIFAQFSRRGVSDARYAKPDIHSSNSRGSGDSTEISSPEEGWWNRMRWACRK